MPSFSRRSDASDDQQQLEAPPAPPPHSPLPRHHHHAAPPAPGALSLYRLPHSTEDVVKDQRRLRLLRHAAQCAECEGCQLGPRCAAARALWRHMMSCEVGPLCGMAGCCASMQLLLHHGVCQSASCPVCVPVKVLSGTVAIAQPLLPPVPPLRL